MRHRAGKLCESHFDALTKLPRRSDTAPQSAESKYWKNLRADKMFPQFRPKPHIAKPIPCLLAPSTQLSSRLSWFRCGWRHPSTGGLVTHNSSRSFVFDGNRTTFPLWGCGRSRKIVKWSRNRKNRIIFQWLVASYRQGRNFSSSKFIRRATEQRKSILVPSDELELSLRLFISIGSRVVHLQVLCASFWCRNINEQRGEANALRKSLSDVSSCRARFNLIETAVVAMFELTFGYRGLLLPREECFMSMGWLQST